MDSGPSNIEGACMVAVRNHYGGKAKDLRVIRSEDSGPNATVVVSAQRETWRCLVAYDGNVLDLGVVE